MDRFQKKRGGIPWCLILDPEGTTLDASDSLKGNIGFPGSKCGIDDFMQMLPTTKQRDLRRCTRISRRIGRAVRALKLGCGSVWMIRCCVWTVVSLVSLVPGLCESAEPAQPKLLSISGQVVDEQGTGVADIDVRGISRDETFHATTDAQGRFSLNVPSRLSWSTVILADDPRQNRIGAFEASLKQPFKDGMSLTIPLLAARRLPVEVTDADGKPAANATVGALLKFVALPPATTNEAGRVDLKLPQQVVIDSLYAVRTEGEFDYKTAEPDNPDPLPRWIEQAPARFQLAPTRTVRLHLVDSNGKPIPETEIFMDSLSGPKTNRPFYPGRTPKLFRTRTDDTGTAVFEMPDWRMPLEFQPANEAYICDRIEFDFDRSPDGNMTVTLHRHVTARGVVQFADGRPVEGVQLEAVGSGYKLGGCHVHARTDAEGRFEMRLNPDLLYLFAVSDPKWGAPLIDGIVAVPGKPIEGLKFQVRHATRIHGRVTAGPEAKPVAGQRVVLNEDGRALLHLEGVHLPNPTNSNNWVQPRLTRLKWTDAAGRFEFFVGPGKYTLTGPSQVESKDFEIADETELEVNFAAPRPETGPFAGKVVTGETPQGVPQALVQGFYRSESTGRPLELKADDQGRFSGERALHRTVLYARSPDGAIAGMREIGPDDQQATISIGPVASAKARLLDGATGAPLAGTEVHWGRKVLLRDENGPWEGVAGGSSVTDEQGRFEAMGLVVGQTYYLLVREGGRSSIVSNHMPKSAGSADLGDLQRKPPSRPLTLADRIERAFTSKQPVRERYDEAVRESPMFRQHVLLVFLERDQPVTESWFKLAFEDRQVRTQLYNFKVLPIDVKADGAAALAKQLGIALEPQALPQWSLRDGAGDELARGAVPLDPVDSLVDRMAVLDQLKRFAPETLDARQLLSAALADAKRSQRRVIVQQTATWCPPCHRLTLYLDAHRSIWEKDYIWVRMDERWTGCEEVMGGFQEKRGGIPWFAILDADSKTLATSDGPHGNIGFPGDDPGGIEHFVQMLQSTKQRLTEEDLATLRQHLEKK
jgi:hypothetical protein